MAYRGEVGVAELRLAGGVWSLGVDRLVTARPARRVSSKHTSIDRSMPVEVVDLRG